MPRGFLDKLSQWPDPAQARFVEIRDIILCAAQDICPVGESLKWGEPAWRPVKQRQGSTLRVSWSPMHAATLGVFVNCKTTLAETMRDVYPDVFTYEDNRVLRMLLSDHIPQQAIDHLARLTFTYHRSG